VYICVAKVNRHLQRDIIASACNCHRCKVTQAIQSASTNCKTMPWSLSLWQKRGHEVLTVGTRLHCVGLE